MDRCGSVGSHCSAGSHLCGVVAMEVALVCKHGHPCADRTDTGVGKALGLVAIVVDSGCLT